MKIGLDIHGVIDKYPDFFSELTKKLLDNGHEVHILTGTEINEEVLGLLNKNNIKYTELFSITDHHRKIGTEITYLNGDLRHPFIEDALWNKTKGDYCDLNCIDIHVDDTEVYGEHFNTTIFILISDDDWLAKLNEYLFERKDGQTQRK